MIRTCTCCGKQFETDNYAKKCCSQECATKMTKANMKEKECEICHQMFIPKSGVSKICDREHYFACEVCGKSFLMTKKMYHDGITTCSRKCSREKTKLRNQAKYGCDHPMQNKEVQEHFKQSMLNKYGVEHALQSEEIRSKTIDTNRERFGVDWSLSSAEIHDQIKETMLKKYGGATTFESEELSNKVQRTMIEKYGVENAMQSQNILEKAQQTNIERYGVANVMQNADICAASVATRAAKRPQKKLINIDPTEIESDVSLCNKFKDKLTHELGLEIESNFKLDDLRFDIHIKGTNILISIDSTSLRSADKGVDKKFRKHEYSVAQKLDYRCIHVFDWDDWDKVIDLIRPKQVIYARDCSILKLNEDVTDEFLSKYHLQGTVKGQVLRLGLVKDDEIFQVMTFGKSRYNKNYSAELLRLCSRSGYAIVGGAEKLFKFAVDALCVNNIISYCDLSKFEGTVYERLGMKLLNRTEPQEVWSRGSEKITANLLRQRGFDQLFGTDFGKGVSNESLMLQHGWLPVFDCGQNVYVF